MTDPNPPAWVSKRDGRLVPFDADHISRSLFAASETLGLPDAFLARELTDGVVHFLAMDSEGQTPTTARIAEVVAQVVRELGRPDLAHVFAEHGRHRVRTESLSARLASARQQTSGTYSRDLEAACEAGLLILPPTEADLLASGVIGPPVADLVTDLRSLRHLVGGAVALDGLESRAASGVTCHDLGGQIAQALAETHWTATINLNLAAPTWADPVAAGPLFAAEPGLDPDRLSRLADELLDEILAHPLPGVSIDWHLSGSDFEAGKRDRLERIVARVLGEGLPIGFVFDRPRRPLALGVGLDRRHPAVLLEVGLNLPALAHQAGLLADAGRFRQRLGTLVRLALSAAAQKRDHVRQAERRRLAAGQGAALTSGFLLDRARVVVIPVGLDEVVTQFTGWSMSIGGEPLDFARTMVCRLREALDHDGRLAQMDCCLDGPIGFTLSNGPVVRQSVAGLTPWDAGASLRSQIRAGTALHAISEAATLALFVPTETTAPELADVLQGVWRQTGIVRLRVVRQNEQ